MRFRFDEGGYQVHNDPGYTLRYDTGVTINNQSPFTCRWRNYGRYLNDDPRYVRIVLEGGRRVLAFKNVSHIQWSGDFTGAKLTYHYSDPPPGTVSNLDTRTGSGLMDSEGYMNLSDEALKVCTDRIKTVLGSANVYTGHNTRWDAVRPTMTTRANLAVFLAELRDIKRMFELLPRKHFNLRDWKQVFRYVNGLHLNYNFGWKPFIRDLRAFTRAHGDFEKRLHKFMMNDMKPLKRSKRDTPVEITLDWTVPFVGQWIKSYTSTVKVTRGSTFMFSYILPQYNWDELRWRAWADSLGLHLSPKNVWAILPWSFVVDWFVDVSGFLGQWDEDWINPEVSFAQACSTELIEAIVHCNLKGPSGWGTPSGTIWEIKYRKFTRAIGVPQFQWDSQSLNADRIRLLASLIASRVV